MKYDLIIVSQSKDELIPITQNCINSALEDKADVNVIIVETSGQIVKYKGANDYILYQGHFNYNHALNLGIQKGKGEVYILANNDLIFQPGWSKIGELMKINGYHSASVRNGNQRMYKEDNVIYDGYVIGSILTGWCIFADRYCIEKIGGLDETVSFWYSDNIYACQLQAVGIMHGLFCNCRVDHITSRTLRKQPISKQRQITSGEYHRFYQRKKYYDNLERINVLKEHKNR